MKTYDFCFDNLTIGDYLDLTNPHYYQKSGQEIPPEVLHKVFEVAGKYTNIVPLDLPAIEMPRFLIQLMEALNEYARERQ